MIWTYSFYNLAFLAFELYQENWKRCFFQFLYLSYHKLNKGLDDFIFLLTKVFYLHFYVYVKICFTCKLDFGQTTFYIHFAMFLPHRLWDWIEFKHSISNSDSKRENAFSYHDKFFGPPSILFILHLCGTNKIKNWKLMPYNVVDSKN